MIPAVKQVEAQSDYVLTVQFETRETGELDMKPYLDLGLTALKRHHLAQNSFPPAFWFRFG